MPNVGSNVLGHIAGIFFRLTSLQTKNNSMVNTKAGMSMAKWEFTNISMGIREEHGSEAPLHKKMILTYMSHIAPHTITSHVTTSTNGLP